MIGPGKPVVLQLIQESQLFCDWSKEASCYMIGPGKPAVFFIDPGKPAVI